MSDINWDREGLEKLILERETWKLEDGRYQCPLCDKISDIRGIRNHLAMSHFGRPNGMFSKKAWNMGLTKETDKRVKQYSETRKKRLISGEIIPHNKGKSVSEETKKKISNSMKKAVKEGRANGWKNVQKYGKVSYPEKFFMKVIKNEFTDKRYKFQRQFGRFSLDFAWEHLKKCIEIDGQQHHQFQDYIERDTRKDTALKDAGWQVLRIYWKDMFNEPQKYIQIALDFIEEDILHLEDNMLKYKLEIEEYEKQQIQKEIDKINKIHDIAIKVNNLIDANIDFSKRGSFAKAGLVIGCKGQHARKWINRHCPKSLQELIL